MVIIEAFVKVRMDDGTISEHQATETEIKSYLSANPLYRAIVYSGLARIIQDRAGTPATNQRAGERGEGTRGGSANVGGTQE
jgi:hypothetical protein